MIKVFQSFVCNMCTSYLKGPEMTPLKQEEYKFDKASNTSKWFKIYKINKEGAYGYRYCKSMKNTLDDTK